MTANKISMAKNNLVPMLSVSSWAIVVDVVWKKAFADVRLINTVDDTKTPPNLKTDANWQALGAIGDTLGVVVSVKG